MSWVNRFLDWIRNLFWSEEMELSLVGLQNSGKTTFIDVVAVSFVLLLNNNVYVLFYVFCVNETRSGTHWYRVLCLFCRC